MERGTDTSTLREDAASALSPSCKREPTSPITLPLPDLIISSSSSYTPKKNYQFHGGSKPPHAELDPRFTRCAFCDSKHPRPSWGCYRRVSNELFKMLIAKGVKNPQLNSFICEPAYNYLMGISDEPPSDSRFAYSTRAQSGIEALVNKVCVPFSSGNLKSVPPPSAVQAPSSLDQNLRPDAGRAATLNTPSYRFGSGVTQEPSLPDEIEKVIDNRVKAMVHEYAKAVDAYSEAGSVVAQLAEEQQNMVNLVSKLMSGIQRITKGDEPPPRKRAKGDVAQAIESFSDKIDAIAGTAKAASAIEITMGSIKSDLENIAQGQSNSTTTNKK